MVSNNVLETFQVKIYDLTAKQTQTVQDFFKK